MRTLFIAIILASLGGSPVAAQSSREIGNKVASIFTLQHAIDLRDTTYTITFSATAEREYKSLLSEVATSDLEPAEKVALTTILNIAAERRASPDRVADQMQLLAQALADGSWSDFGIPVEILPPPTPERRSQIMQMLFAWIERRREECLQE